MKSEKSKMSKMAKVLVTSLINGKISRKGAKAQSLGGARLAGM